MGDDYTDFHANLTSHVLKVTQILLTLIPFSNFIYNFAPFVLFGDKGLQGPPHSFYTKKYI